MIALDLALLVLTTPLLLAATYLAVLAGAARTPARSAPRSTTPALAFDVVVPAHDEEDGIAATVRSVLAVDYPRALVRVLVVADNCADGTAEEAARAGAIVLVRDDPSRRGKGYALEHAFRRVEADQVADAVVVVDADTIVSSSLLSALAEKFAQGALAVQADYRVRNVEASWRTRLMALALALFHGLRSLGRERLGLSSGLRGNGMAFRRALLRDVPYRAHSRVEDVEYGLALGEAGVRVHFAADARVFGEMTSRASASRSQRERWERGRAALARRDGARLFVAAMRARDPMLLDLALDLLVPPLTALTAAVALVLAAAAWRTCVAPTSNVALVALVAAAIACVELVFYVLRGWWMSGVGVRGLAALAWAPVYALWKLALALRALSRRDDDRWVRTLRERRSP